MLPPPRWACCRIRPTNHSTTKGHAHSSYQKGTLTMSYFFLHVIPVQQIIAAPGMAAVLFSNSNPSPFSVFLYSPVEFSAHIQTRGFVYINPCIHSLYRRCKNFFRLRRNQNALPTVSQYWAQDTLPVYKSMALSTPLSPSIT